jgi:hypothetical protein
LNNDLKSEVISLLFKELVVEYKT